MRQMEFKMERPGLVEPGQIVDVTEGVVAAYFYQGYYVVCEFDEEDVE